MAQCKPQERILSSASALAAGRAYRLAGKVEQAQTFERRGEKILSLMACEADVEGKYNFDFIVDNMLTSWEASNIDNPLYIHEWMIALRECLDRELADLDKEINL
jgi:hypothetical protein